MLFKCFFSNLLGKAVEHASGILCAKGSLEDNVPSLWWWWNKLIAKDPGISWPFHLLSYVRITISEMVNRKMATCGDLEFPAHMAVKGNWDTQNDSVQLWWIGSPKAHHKAFTAVQMESMQFWCVDPQDQNGRIICPSKWCFIEISYKRCKKILVVTGILCRGPPPQYTLWQMQGTLSTSTFIIPSYSVYIGRTQYPSKSML